MKLYVIGISTDVSLIVITFELATSLVKASSEYTLITKYSVPSVEKSLIRVKDKPTLPSPHIVRSSFTETILEFITIEPLISDKSNWLTLASPVTIPLASVDNTL